MWPLIKAQKNQIKIFSLLDFQKSRSNLMWFNKAAAGVFSGN